MTEKKKIRPQHYIIKEYWLEYYCDELCTLCGNSGIVDTTNTAISPMGKKVGRKNLCICPNGQTMRAGGVSV